MTAFKKEILTRFIGTDEVEVTENYTEYVFGNLTEYLGCELIRNRLAKTAQ